MTLKASLGCIEKRDAIVLGATATHSSRSLGEVSTMGIPSSCEQPIASSPSEMSKTTSSLFSSAIYLKSRGNREFDWSNPPFHRKSSERARRRDEENSPYHQIANDLKLSLQSLHAAEVSRLITSPGHTSLAARALHTIP